MILAGCVMALIASSRQQAHRWDSQAAREIERLCPWMLMLTQSSLPRTVSH